jgi:hypothetical protein
MRRQVLLVTMAVGSACASDGVVGDECDGKCDDLGDGSDGSEVVRCWVIPDQNDDDPFFAVDALTCSTRAAPVELFATSIQVETATGHVDSLRYDGGEVEVEKSIRLGRKEFPIAVFVNLTVAVSDPLSDLGVHELSVRFDVDDPAALPADDPKTIHFPLRKAPVTLYAGVDATVSVEYELDVSPFVHGSLLNVPPSDAHTVEVSAINANLQFGERVTSEVWAGHAQGTVSLSATIDGTVHQAEIELPSESFLSADGIRPAARSDHAGDGTEVARCRIAEGAAVCRATGPALDLTAAVGDGPVVSLGADDVEVAPLAGDTAAIALQGSLADLTGWSAPPDQAFALSAQLTGGDEVPVRLPFDIWSLELSHQGAFATIDLQAYDLLLGDMWPDRFAVHAGSELINVVGATSTMSVAAPAESAGLPCRVTFLGPDDQLSEYDAVLTAGAFEVTATGLVPK